MDDRDRTTAGVLAPASDRHLLKIHSTGHEPCGKHTHSHTRHAHTQREREREREIYIYINTHTHTRTRAHNLIPKSLASYTAIAMLCPALCRAHGLCAHRNYMLRTLLTLGCRIEGRSQKCKPCFTTACIQLRRSCRHKFQQLVASDMLMISHDHTICG